MYELNIRYTSGYDNPQGRQDARTGRRAELLEELALAGRAMSAATVMFHATVAERQGLSATEEKALDLLERFGPLTAGGWPSGRGWSRRR